MKKIICFLLSCIMGLSCLSIPAGAESGTNPPGLGARWDKELVFEFVDGDTYPYTGKPITPKLLIKDKAGKALTEGVDYRVEYWNNTNPGTAMVYIFPSGSASSAYGGTGYSIMMFSITGKKPDEFEMPDFDSFKLPEVSPMKVPDWVKEVEESNAQPQLPKTSITKVTAGKKGKIEIKWKKCSKITGYQIQYSTNKNFKKNVKSKKVGKKKTSITISGLKRKKTYYVQIRTYKKANGNTKYGKWSGKKKTKTK